MEVKGKPLSYLPLIPLRGLRGDNSVFSPSHSPEGERGEDTIRMDKAPPLRGGGGEVKGTISIMRL